MNPPTHNTNKFVWDPITRRLTTWEWELRAAQPELWEESMEGDYKNAYLRLFNPKTSKTIICSADRLLEGESPTFPILGHVFIPIPEECEKNPKLHGLEVHIMKDL